MLRNYLLPLLCTLLWMAHESKGYPQETKEDNRYVVLKEKVDFQVNGKRIGSAREGTVVQVDLVQGDWLWVGSRQAYLEKQDAVPIAAAEAHYSQIIESKKETSSYFRRAKFYRSAGSFDKALADIAEALRLMPGDMELMIYKGMLQIDKKDYDGAVATFNQGYAMIEATRKEVSVADMSLIGDTMQMVNARVLLLNNRGWAHSENKKYDLAIGDFTRASLLDPKYARALLNRAITYERRGELDKAIEDYNDVLQMVPNFAKGFNNRGKILFQKGMLDQAIKDYSEAIRLDPTFTLAYNNRRIAWEAKGDWTSLSEELNKLVNGNAPSIDDVNAMAWLSATCPQDAFRNGQLAVRLAKSVCEATAWKSPGMLDTLAAAYAEAGDFSSAVETQTKALAMATEMQRGDYQARLKLYQENKPFRVPSK